MLSEANIKKVQIICPICKSKELITLPLKVIRTTSQLTTISIPKGKVCDHHFQIFIDKAFNIRGYQKVDFELESSHKLIKGNINTFVDGLEMLQKNLEEKNSFRTSMPISSESKSESVLRTIYEDFWEFIDDNNEEFQKFILKDKRRRKILHNLGEIKNYKSQFTEILQKVN